MNKLERWLCFFVGYEEEIMPNIAEVEPAIGEALLQERAFVMDERLRMAYIDDLMDIYSEFRREAKRRKLEEERRSLAGEREILIERERKAITRLFEMGMPIIDISKTVGITEREVRNLIA